MKQAKPSWKHVDEMTSRPGWAQRYLIDADAIFVGRWNWWLDVLDRGFVGPDQIPRVEFRNISSGFADDSHIDRFIGYMREKGADVPRNKALEIVGSRGQNVSSVLKVFRRAYDRGTSLFNCIQWWLWAFGSKTVRDGERPHLEESIAVSMYHEISLHSFLSAPGDWGCLLASEYYGDRAKRGTAWFPTPVELCEMIARMQFGEDDCRFKTVMDPCVGTGPMLLVASNYSLRLYGIDIDRVMCALCEFNSWLFVPWLAIPGGSRVIEFNDKTGEELCHSQPEIVIKKTKQMQLF